MSASKSTRPVNTDGANFSKGPSKPVPLNPRSRPLNRNRSIDSNSVPNIEEFVDEQDSCETPAEKVIETQDEPPKETIINKPDEVDQPSSPVLRNQADKSSKVTKKATKDSSKRSSMKGFKDFFGSIGRKKGEKTKKMLSEAQIKEEAE